MTKKQKKSVIDHIDAMAREAEVVVYFLGQDPMEFAEAIIGVNFICSSTHGSHVVYDCEKVMSIPLPELHSWMDNMDRVTKAPKKDGDWTVMTIANLYRATARQRAVAFVRTMKD